MADEKEAPPVSTGLTGAGATILMTLKEPTWFERRDGGTQDVIVISLFIGFVLSPFFMLLNIYGVSPYGFILFGLVFFGCITPFLKITGPAHAAAEKARRQAKDV